MANFQGRGDSPQNPLGFVPEAKSWASKLALIPTVLHYHLL